MKTITSLPVDRVRHYCERSEWKLLMKNKTETCLNKIYVSRRAIERFSASLKEDEGNEESMVGLARTHLRRSAKRPRTTLTLSACTQSSPETRLIAAACIYESSCGVQTMNPLCRTRALPLRLEPRKRSQLVSPSHEMVTTLSFDRNELDQCERLCETALRVSDGTGEAASMILGEVQ